MILSYEHTPQHPGSSCDCRTASGNASGVPTVLALLLLGTAVRRRRRNAHNVV